MNPAQHDEAQLKSMHHSRQQLRAFVRFSLSQARSRNEHHRFEQLCEAVARQRITPNILTATGPVSAGGDQGRDFETFRGYGDRQIRDFGKTIGVLATDSIVFCCSVALGDIAKKVRSDLKKVMEAGPQPSVVIFMCEQDVPTAVRHRLVSFATKTHKVRLEIMDGTTLTNLLCEPDSFWIAVDFLDVPIHLAPRGSGPDWYTECRTRWLEREVPAHSSADLIELTSCIRFATFNVEARDDVNFWLTRLSPLGEESVERRIRQRARYEISVASYRGLGDMRPVDQVVSNLIQEALQSDSFPELESATILAQYAQGAWLFGRTKIPREVVDSFGDTLEQRIQILAEKAHNDEVRRCLLLCLLGYSKLRHKLGTMDLPDAPLGPMAPPPPEACDDWRRNSSKIPITDWHTESISDRNGAVSDWSKAIDLIERNPLVPVEKFADDVSFFTPVLFDVAGWDDLVTKLDARIASSAGRQTMASLAHSRASLLRTVDQPLAALRELNRARVLSIQGDTLFEGSQMLLDAAAMYRDLDLFYAAKHYALAAGAVAAAGSEIQHPLVAEAMVLSASCDFLAGNWLSLLSSLPSTVTSHLDLRVSGYELTAWDDTAHLINLLAIVIKFADLTSNKQLTDWIDSRLELSAVDPSEIRNAIHETSIPFSDLETGISFIQSQLDQQAFADAGEQRLIQFAARGVKVRIRAQNTYDDIRAAERFASAFQLIVAAMGEEDLLLVRTTLDVAITTTPAKKKAKAANQMPRLIEPSDDERRRWEVVLTRDAGPHSIDFRQATQEIVTNVLVTLTSLSALPQKELEKIIGKPSNHDAMFDAALPHIRYDRAYAVIDTEDFNADLRRSLSPFGGPGFGEVLLSEHLAPIRTPGPVFGPEIPAERPAGRYAMLIPALGNITDMMARDDDSSSVIRLLREEGWKDWHLLMAIFNFVANSLISSEAEPLTQEAMMNRMMDLAKGELLNIPFDISLITEDALRQHLRYSFAATANAYGLEIRLPFSYDELLALLAERYSYWKDDAPHDDPFVWRATPPSA